MNIAVHHVLDLYIPPGHRVAAMTSYCGKLYAITDRGALFVVEGLWPA